MRIVLVGILAVLWSVAAIAQGTAAYGLGTKQCGEYLADMAKTGNAFDSVAAAQYADWAAGYVTGYNAFSSREQVTISLPRATIIAFLNKYCGDKPLNAVVAAIDCLIANEGGPKLSHCQ